MIPSTTPTSPPVLQRIDDYIVFPLPAKWFDLPEEMQLGLCWWNLMDLIYLRRVDGDIQPISALCDVDIQILRDPAAARMYVPRSHQPSVNLEFAVHALEAGDNPWVIGEFSYDGPVKS